jgi:hypothetical protein
MYVYVKVGAVIHQPRVEVFLGIDDVIFLGKGGRVAYYGPAKVQSPQSTRHENDWGQLCPVFHSFKGP